MSSRRLLRAFSLAAALLVGASSCSLYEGPPPPKKKEFTKLGCLKDFGARFVDYFAGRAAPADVERLAACSITAMRTFQDLARGEKKDRFTAIEVRNFLQRYFLEDIVITDGLLDELMKIKSAFLGGKDGDFTPADLDAAQELILNVRDALLVLQPSMPMSIDRMRRESPEYVDAAAKNLAAASEIVGRRIVGGENAYTLTDLERLLDELAKAFPTRADVLKPVRDHLSLAFRVKQMLVAPYDPTDELTADQWKLLLADGSRWFGAYAKFVNLDSRFPEWTRGEGRERLAVIVNEVIDLMERATRRHCSPTYRVRGGCSIVPGIELKSIRELILKSDWNGQLKKESIASIVGPIVTRILGETDFSETGRIATRLTASHFGRLRGLFREWYDGSRYLETLYAMETGDRAFPSDATVPTDRLVAHAAREVMREAGARDDEDISAAEQMRSTIAKTYALSAGASSLVLYDGQNRSRERSYAELARYLWLQPLLRRVVLGYVGFDRLRRLKAPPEGLLRAEFAGAIRDYWHVLLDYKLVAESVNTPEGDAKKRFREAAIFTQASNGDDQISVDEGVQLVLIMLSADPMTKAANQKLSDTGMCLTGPDDVYGEKTIEFNCYRRNFYDFSPTSPFADLWSHFPRLMEFINRLPAKRQDEFRLYLETASRKHGYQATVYFDSSDAQSTLVLFHYLEGLFLRFDANVDGAIDAMEAEKAYPFFKLTLAEFAGMDPENPMVKKIFMYLLDKGRPPVTDQMGNWTRFWNKVGFFFWTWRTPKFEADRLGLLKVFAAIASPPPPRR